MTGIYCGAQFDLPHIIDTHLFVISPNNSGSTLLKKLISTSENVWSLCREGQHTFGFSGPETHNKEYALIWASKPEWLNIFSDVSRFNWEKTRKAWYFQATSKKSDATIFIEKSPPALVYIDQLNENFKNCKFLFMTRNPYAVVEGIERWVRSKNVTEYSCKTAAHHIIKCFEIQKHNIEKYRDSGLYVRYESLCEDPGLMRDRIIEFIPQLEGLDFHQKISVKQIYNESPRNMNAQQIKRLTLDQIREINEVFVNHEHLLDYFGYALINDPEL